MLICVRQWRDRELLSSGSGDYQPGQTHALPTLEEGVAGTPDSAHDEDSLLRGTDPDIHLCLSPSGKRVRILLCVSSLTFNYEKDQLNQ